MKQQHLNQKFYSSPTKAVVTPTLGSGLGAMLKGFGVLIGGLLIAGYSGSNTAAYVVVLWVLYYFGRGIYEAVYGTREAVRIGECPHCDVPVSIGNEEYTSTSCPSCKHRLTLRGDRLFDVTAL